MILEELLQPHVRQWIKEHENDEPAHLMLQAHRFPDIPVREAVSQIQARQKVRHKLPAWYKRASLVYPPALAVEQASSEETAHYKAHLLKGTSMADLTGGMGVDTYYLSRNFKKAFYIEQQEILCQAAAHNFRELGVTHVQLVNSPAEEWIAKAPALDAIYLDPARRGEGNQKLYKLAHCQPDISSLLPQLLEKTDTVLLKAAPMLDISQGLSELSHVQEVHVVAVKNEVKELLFLIKKGYNGQVLIQAVNLTAGGQQSFRFSQTAEQAAQANYVEPQAYLYEPHAALMKAGAFNLVAQRYQLHKLHPNTHLYTANTLISEFPGRSFRILYTGKPDKKVIRQLLPVGKALISSRNHPLSVQQISKKFNLQEGGSRYLFAATFSNGKSGLIVCEKISKDH